MILPPVIFDSEADEIEKMLVRARASGISHALISNIGHITLAKKHGFICHGDLRLNVYNSESADTLLSLGLQDLMLSPELSLAQSRDVDAPAAVVVYGRLPLMTLERCVIEDCKACQKNSFTLSDRKNIRFPVFREFPHRNVLYNSVPTYMADKQDELARCRLLRTHFIFTDESAKKASDIINAYKTNRAPEDNVRRIK